MAKIKCFVDKELCDTKCVLYRKGIRYFDGRERKSEPFEECAINIIADGIENMVSRTVGLQAEQNKATNAMVTLSALMQFAAERNMKKTKMVKG